MKGHAADAHMLGCKLLKIVLLVHRFYFLFLVQFTELL